MALLMIGVATKRERGELVLWLAILIIGAAGVFVARGEGTATLFSGSFIVDPYARVLKLLTLTGAAAALLMSIDYWRRAGGLRFRVPRARSARHDRHDDDDLGQRSHLALCRT